MAIRKSLSTKRDPNGYAQIMLLVEKGRNGRFRLKSGVFVPVEYWNEKKNEITIPRKIGADLLETLQTIKDSINTKVDQIESLIRVFGDRADKEFIQNTLPLLENYSGVITERTINELIDTKEFQEQQTKIEQQQKNIFAHTETFLDSKKYVIGRVRHFRVLFRSMARYDIFRNMIVKDPFTWNIDTVTPDDIENFFDYLSKEHLHRVKYAKIFDKIKVIYNEENKAKHKTYHIEERGENRLVSMRKSLRTFWNWLIDTNKTENDPFRGIKIGTEKYGTPYYITIQERNLIADFDLSTKPSLAVQRDIFIFQCLVGCRVGDLMKFTPENIVNDILTYTPHKTKDETSSFVARVPLSDMAMSLINKYQGKDKHGRLFPFIAEQNYNDSIKDIFRICGITRNVSVRNSKTGENEMIPICEVASSHMARRTFVGNAYKIVKDPNLIGKMSGHVEGSKAFVRYRDIDNETLKEVINAMQ